MSRTLHELLAVLDNLTESWKTLGHPTQSKVQREAMAELKALLPDATVVQREPDPAPKKQTRR